MAIDISRVKPKKLYFKNDKKNQWQTMLGTSIVREVSLGRYCLTNLPSYVRFFRLSPAVGAFGTRMLDVDYGCGWLITAENGGICGSYFRPIDYKPSLNCKDYPILSEEQIVDCIIEHVAHNPYDVQNIPFGVIQTKEDAKRLVDRYKEVSKSKTNIMNNNSSVETIKHYTEKEKEFLNKHLKEMLKNQKNMDKAMEINI